MSNLRKTVSRRLVAVKNETAMLTTFNEVNMQPIMDLRAKFKEELRGKLLVNLRIPDDYQFQDAALVELLRERLHAYFGHDLLAAP